MSWEGREAVRKAHHSPDEVGVCGVQGRVSALLPLEGENDDDDENAEPKREHSRRKRRRSYNCKG